MKKIDTNWVWIAGVIIAAMAVMPLIAMGGEKLGNAIDKWEKAKADTANVEYVARCTPQASRFYFCKEDFDEKQLKVCEDLLQECENAELLDAKGVKRFHEIQANPNVPEYIELISECEAEDNFYDTVGEGDTWCIYLHFVLQPRGLAD